MSQELRVALVDWNQSVRSARRQILDVTPGVTVVFESDGNSEHLKQLPDLLVDVLVIDQQLEQFSGTEAYFQLRQSYEELSDVPPAVLTSTFDLPELRMSCLAAGMRELVSIEAGPEELIRAISSAASHQKVTEIEEMAELIRVCKLAQKSDFSFTQSVNSLPFRKRALVDKLAQQWQLLQTGSKAKFSIDQLEPLLAPLGALTTGELVIKFYQNGFLSGS